MRVICQKEWLRLKFKRKILPKGRGDDNGKNASNKYKHTRVTYPFIVFCDPWILFCTRHPGVSDFSETWFVSTSSRIAALSAFVLFNLSLDKLLLLYRPLIGAKLLSENALKPFNFPSFWYFSLIILDDISQTNYRTTAVNLSCLVTDAGLQERNVMPATDDADKTMQLEPIRDANAFYKSTML